MRLYAISFKGLLMGSALLLALFSTVVVAAIAASPKQASVGNDLTQYVNPFIGTAPAPTARFGLAYNSGDVFPDATYPLGMLQWGPDTTTHIAGGYNYPDNTITGFSLTHFSGRGVPAYQDIPFMPFVGSTPGTSTFSHTNESAHPGYYSVHLDQSGVLVELAAATHSGIGQFTYPASTSASMFINAASAITTNQGATVTIDSAHQQVSGQTSNRVGGGSQYYTLYFVAKFDQPFTKTGGNGTGAATLTFDTTHNQVVHVRVGISYVSVANAENNLSSEIGNASFTTVRDAASQAWNARLHSIEVQGGTSDEQIVFYTALYHTFFHPNIFNDVNGQYMGFDGQVHTLSPGQHAQYENVANWDQYRSLIPLRAIIAPDETSDLAQSLVNDAQQGDGHLPRWEQTNLDSAGMNGDGADVDIATAYAFGDRNFDTSGALQAMINGQVKIRQGYDDYVRLGYVADKTNGHSVSMTQEYTNDDFALSQFAQALGDKTNYATYLKRSGNWRNVFNSGVGFVQPRESNGSWAPNFNQRSNSGFQETDPAQSTWMESFDLQDLFAKLGGNSKVVSRLDTFFAHLNEGTSSAYAYMGNEPSLEIPWEYDFAGAPSHTQQVVRRIQTQLFTNTPGGLPGNDDGGTLSAWYVFSALGLYPEIVGTGGFVIGSPLFTSVNLHLAGQHVVQITAPLAADGSPYVNGMRINGNMATKLWLPWTTLQNGATLSFEMRSSPTPWGRTVADAPPSFPPNATSNSR